VSLLSAVSFSKTVAKKTSSPWEKVKNRISASRPITPKDVTLRMTSQSFMPGARSHWGQTPHHEYRARKPQPCRLVPGHPGYTAQTSIMLLDSLALGPVRHCSQLCRWSAFSCGDVYFFYSLSERHNHHCRYAAQHRKQKHFEGWIGSACSRPCSSCCWTMLNNLYGVRWSRAHAYTINLLYEEKRRRDDFLYFLV